MILPSPIPELGPQAWLAAALLAHVGLGEHGLVKVGPIQYALQWLYAVGEPTILRWTDWLITRPWATGTPWGRALLQSLAIASHLLPHGVILTTPAAVRFAAHLEALEGPKGARLAVGPCVCQHALDRWEEPSCKDVVLLYGAEIYHRLERGYRLIDADEAAEIFKRCGEAGLVHSVDFCMQSGRWSFVVCNCDAEICLLTRVHKLTGRFLYPGPERSRLDAARCRGAEACGACLGACIFDAIRASEDGIRIDAARCLGCGRCADRCEALSMEPRPGGGHPLGSAPWKVEPTNQA
jgi:Pyruvate/2-oxoacid:ferredoxin oxidoreductase delta subunit